MLVAPFASCRAPFFSLLMLQYQWIRMAFNCSLNGPGCCILKDSIVMRRRWRRQSLRANSIGREKLISIFERPVCLIDAPVYWENSCSYKGIRLGWTSSRNGLKAKYCRVCLSIRPAERRRLDVASFGRGKAVSGRVVSQDPVRVGIVIGLFDVAGDLLRSIIPV